MQLVPRTGRWIGASNLIDPAQNIQAGAKYLRTSPTVQRRPAEDRSPRTTPARGTCAFQRRAPVPGDAQLRRAGEELPAGPRRPARDACRRAGGGVGRAIQSRSVRPSSRRRSHRHGDRRPRSRFSSSSACTRSTQFFTVAATTFLAWGVADLLATILEKPRLKDRSPGRGD